MRQLASESRAMHNPALGATLLWRFACGYSPEGSTRGTPLPLLFIVLPIVLHQATNRNVIGTQLGSGLHKFEEKFATKGDMLLAIQPRAMAMRDLSLRSLRIALASGLVSLVPEQGAVWPLSYAPPPTDSKATGALFKGAEKLGRWTGNMSLFEASGTLRVEF